MTRKLDPDQLRTLAAVVHIPPTPSVSGATVAEVADALKLTRDAARRRLWRLDRRGFVAVTGTDTVQYDLTGGRNPGGGHVYVVNVYKLTPRGREVVDDLLAAHPRARRDSQLLAAMNDAAAVTR